MSSYAPLALACLLGFFALCLMIIRSTANTKRIDLTIQEITSISQMSMTIGLFLLAIGTFLGGVWANESWGRYWGWDPKETWALISVVVYAFVLHMRLIPGLKGTFAINLASVIAFSSIVMTSLPWLSFWRQCEHEGELNYSKSLEVGSEWLHDSLVYSYREKNQWKEHRKPIHKPNRPVHAKYFTTHQLCLAMGFSHH